MHPTQFQYVNKHVGVAEFAIGAIHEIVKRFFQFCLFDTLVGAPGFPIIASQSGIALEVMGLPTFADIGRYPKHLGACGY